MKNRSGKILIMNPRTRSEGREYYTYVMPIGLAYISAVLKQSGYEVDILNLNHGNDTVEDAIKAAVSGQIYGFILTGGLSVHYKAVKECVDSARKYSSSSRIVLGGGLVSSLPELMLGALQPDYIVIGEGENTIVELLLRLTDNLDVSDVEGIGFRSPDGRPVINQGRKPIKDIDALPWPDYEGLGLSRYIDEIKPTTLYYYDVLDNPRPYPLLASRSCPFQCTFCFHPVGNMYRQRSVENIMAEIAFAFERYQVNFLDIYDELFSITKDRVFEFCRQLKKLIDSVPWEVKWACQMRVDAIDRGVILAMKEAGCCLLSLGLESYSASVLKSMRKKITPGQIDNALRICSELHMGIQGNFIFGDIAETVETSRETLEYWKKANKFVGRGISVGFIQVYPGTALYTHCVENGLVTDQISFIENDLLKPINISKTMTNQEFQELITEVDTIYFEESVDVVPKIRRQPDNSEEMHVKCPFCRKVSIYRNYPAPGSGTYQVKEICCRNCRARFNVVSLWAKVYRGFLKAIGARGRELLMPARRAAARIVAAVRQK